MPFKSSLRIARYLIFCTQPTGSGKSLIYQLFPFALDFCQARKMGSDPKGIKTNNIVLIISPLISLMKDQIAKLEQSDITAINLADAKDPMTKGQLWNGEFTYIFGSPEICDFILNITRRIHALHAFSCIIENCVKRSRLGCERKGSKHLYKHSTEAPTRS